MKTLITAAAITTLIASSALAMPSTHSGKARSADTVVVSISGKVVGQDPDVSIRLELRRNAEKYLGQGAG